MKNSSSFFYGLLVLFSAALALSAPIGPQEWELIKASEIKFWSMIVEETSTPDKRKATKNLAAFVHVQEQGLVQPDLIDLSSSARFESVVSLWAALQKRLNLRESNGHPSKYRTQFSKNPEQSDPYKSHFAYHGSTHKITLNYNGSPITKQVGNYFDQIIGKAAIVYHTPFGNADFFLNKDLEFLLFGEVARRKVNDPHRGINDEFSDLPVCFGLGAAAQLISNGHISSNDVLNKAGAYHFFSGLQNERVAKLRALLGRFKDFYPLSELPIVVENYFQYDPSFGFDLLALNN